MSRLSFGLSRYEIPLLLCIFLVMFGSGIFGKTPDESTMEISFYIGSFGGVVASFMSISAAIFMSQRHGILYLSRILLGVIGIIIFLLLSAFSLFAIGVGNCARKYGSC